MESGKSHHVGTWPLLEKGKAKSYAPAAAENKIA
jgi:hypothetical protein